MEIYLLRHAIAVPAGTPGYPNDDRPLTEDGAQKMIKNAKGIAKLIEKPDIILTSPLLRAHETAQIVAQALECSERVEISEALLPTAPLKDLIVPLSKYKNKERILLVGHEPKLSLIVGALLGNLSLEIDFKKGSLCSIKVRGLPLKNAGSLLWHLTPKQLRAIA